MRVVESSDNVKAHRLAEVACNFFSSGNRGFIRANLIATERCLWALIEVPLFRGEVMGKDWDHYGGKLLWGVLVIHY